MVTIHVERARSSNERVGLYHHMHDVKLERVQYGPYNGKTSTVKTKVGLIYPYKNQRCILLRDPCPLVTRTVSQGSVFLWMALRSMRTLRRSAPPHGGRSKRRRGPGVEARPHQRPP